MARYLEPYVAPTPLPLAPRTGTTSPFVPSTNTTSGTNYIPTMPIYTPGTGFDPTDPNYSTGTVGPTQPTASGTTGPTQGATETLYSPSSYSASAPSYSAMGSVGQFSGFLGGRSQAWQAPSLVTQRPTSGAQPFPYGVRGRKKKTPLDALTEYLMGNHR